MGKYKLNQLVCTFYLKDLDPRQATTFFFFFEQNICTVRGDDWVDFGCQCFERNFASVISKPDWLNNTLSKGQSNLKPFRGY